MTARPGILRETLSAVWPPAVVFVLITLGLELVVRLGWVADFLLPRPSQVLHTLYSDASQLFAAAGQTAWAATVGFCRSVTLGITIAILLSLHPLIRRAFYPFAIFLQTVPVVAIAPVLVIWLGDGKPTVIASAFIASLFPVIAATLAGLNATDPALREMFKLYRAGPVATMLKLRLPAAVPSILTGVRVAAALAVIGAIVGELLVYGGLGTLVTSAQRQQRTDKVFAVLILAALLGVLLTAAVNLISRQLLRRWELPGN